MILQANTQCKCEKRMVTKSKTSGGTKGKASNVSPFISCGNYSRPPLLSNSSSLSNSAFESKYLSYFKLLTCLRFLFRLISSVLLHLLPLFTTFLYIAKSSLNVCISLLTIVFTFNFMFPYLGQTHLISMH